MLQAHDVVEFLQERLEACWCDQVVAGGVAVAGVDADADAGMVFGGDLRDDVAEFGQGAAYRCPLTAHGF